MGKTREIDYYLIGHRLGNCKKSASLLDELSSDKNGEIICSNQAIAKTVLSYKANREFVYETFVPNMLNHFRTVFQGGVNCML